MVKTGANHKFDDMQSDGSYMIKGAGGAAIPADMMSDASYMRKGPPGDMASEVSYMQKAGTGNNVFGDDQSDATYMMGAGPSTGTHMAGQTHHFSDDEEDSVMVRKEDPTEDNEDENGISKIASGIGGFDND